MNATSEDRKFSEYVRRNIEGIAGDAAFLGLSQVWVRECIRHNYAQNFTWLGRPVIQVPQDAYAIQELVWACRPDLIIETGIAHGGSLVMSASMLALLDYCDAVAARQHSRSEGRAAARWWVSTSIFARITAWPSMPIRCVTRYMHQGSSVAPETMRQIAAHAEGCDRIMVFLDSNHTHDHVLAELELYAPYVSKGSYCVVWDTGVEDLPEEMCANRPWGKGNNPKTAVREYMRRLQEEGRKRAIAEPAFRIRSRDRAQDRDHGVAGRLPETI